MQTRSKENPAEQGVSELNPAEIEDNPIEAGNSGLPDLPGKARFAEEEMNIPGHLTQSDAPDSMTEAVMENLRVGVGATSAQEQREEQE